MFSNYSGGTGIGYTFPFQKQKQERKGGQVPSKSKIQYGKHQTLRIENNLGFVAVPSGPIRAVAPSHTGGALPGLGLVLQG